MANTFAQTRYFSKASATNFSATSSWGLNSDGSGSAPATISATDSFVIANGAVMTLNSTATVRQLTISNGSLTVASNS
jgi:hypothetical protein